MGVSEQHFLSEHEGGASTALLEYPWIALRSLSAEGLLRSASVLETHRQLGIREGRSR